MAVLLVRDRGLTQRCYALDASAADDPAGLLPNSETIYFQKSCVYGRYCPKIRMFKANLFEFLNDSLI